MPDASASPTADLYLRFALSGGPEEDAGADDGQADGEAGPRGGAEARRPRDLGPTMTMLRDTLVVIRHPGRAWRLPPHRRLALLIDDDVAGGAFDGALPPLYRAKVALHDAPRAARLLARADLVVASTPVLAGRLRPRTRPGAALHVLPPAWPAAALRPPADGPVTRLALTMGLSHARDAAPLVAVLGRVLEARPALRLTLGRHLGGARALARHPRVTLLPEMPWPAWWDRLRRDRHDLGLVPHLAGGAFNAARSGAKLGEHATWGAAVMGQAGWPALEEAAAAGRALRVAGGAEAWARAVIAAVDDAPATRAVARRAHAALSADADARRQRAFWRAVRDGHDVVAADG